MAKTLLVFIITLAGIVAVLGTECNKPNEEKRCVLACPPQKTCKNKDIRVSCLQQYTENCEDTCVCKEGFYRNPGGECVTEDDCNQCPSQNQYYSCRGKPDRTCASLTETWVNDNQDPDNQDCSMVSAQCEKQCYCNPGTARDENNVCVPYDQCNKPCDIGETKDYCPVDCPNDYCPKSEKSVSCPRPKICPLPQCKCRFNFRRADNGTCIPTRECPPFKCNKPFEKYNPCPPLCPNGYCGQATPTGRCPPIFGRIGIVLECYPKCRCKDGYFWNENKECIPYNKCPGKGDTTTPGPLGLICKPNEVKRCVKQCPPQKTCRNRNVKVSCLLDNTEVCRDTCVCKEGYYRNSVGECVSEEVCNKCTAQNQHYSCRTQPDQTCVTLNQTCATLSQTNQASANGTQCQGKCYCDPGTARDENNVCVPYDQCNQPCDPDETKNYCPVDCPTDYCPKKELKSVSCPQPKPCPKPQCKCGFNYRRADNRTCIPTDQCPPFACEKPNEVYDPCPPLCPNGSCDQATPDGSCPQIFGQILIVLECNPQCRCKDGFWWNSDNVCVPYDQCPGKSNTTASH